MSTWVRRTGTPLRARFVWTDTWILRNGKWQIVASEDLIAPEPAEKPERNDRAEEVMTYVHCGSWLCKNSKAPAVNAIVDLGKVVKGRSPFVSKFR